MSSEIGGSGGVHPTPPSDRPNEETLLEEIEELKRLIEKFSKDFQDAPVEFERALDRLERDASSRWLPADFRASILEAIADVRSFTAPPCSYPKVAAAVMARDMGRLVGALYQFNNPQATPTQIALVRQTAALQYATELYERLYKLGIDDDGMSSVRGSIGEAADALKALAPGAMTREQKEWLKKIEELSLTNRYPPPFTPEDLELAVQAADLSRQLAESVLPHTT